MYQTSIPDGPRKIWAHLTTVIRILLPQTISRFAGVVCSKSFFFKTFLFWLVALVAHVAKHNIECVFIHSMLSFDQKRRLFVDRWFFLLHFIGCAPFLCGYIYVCILVMYLQIKSFNIYVHARWNEINFKCEFY